MTDPTSQLTNRTNGTIAQTTGSANTTTASGQAMSADLAFLNALASAANGTTGASPNPPTNHATQVLTAEWLAMYTLDTLPMPGADSSTSPNTAGLTGGASSNTNGLLQLLLQETGLTSGVPTAGGSAMAQPMAEPMALAPDTTSASSPDMTAAIREASQTYGVPASLIQAVITQESGGNAQAVSSAGAQGLMQLMPATAASLGVSNSFDPLQNVLGGTKYLAQLLNQFNGNTSLAVAAYNAGPGAVESHGGIPPYPETQQYVSNVMALQNRYASV